MNKFKQCTYTVILLLTCIVASPMIFKQIWTTSAEKKKEVAKGTVEIDIHKGEASAEDSAQPTDAPPADGSGQPEVTTLPVTVTDISGSIVTETTETTTVPTTEYAFVEAPDKSYFDDALFIGDSRTVGIQDFGTIDNADYFCDVGMSTSTAKDSSESGTLASMLESNNYGKIYIMLGINEIGNDFDSTFSNFRELVRNVREKAPGAIIYLEANLHVAPFAEDGYINNDRINTLNDMIKTLADNQNIFYIDVNPIFDDANGALREECSEDGIHVLGIYYVSWSDWLALKTVPDNRYYQDTPAQ